MRSVKQRQRQTGSPLPHSRTRRTNSTCTNQSVLLFPRRVARVFLFSFPFFFFLFSPPGFTGKRAAENGSRAINLEARVITRLLPSCVCVCMCANTRAYRQIRRNHRRVILTKVCLQVPGAARNTLMQTRSRRPSVRPENRGFPVMTIEAINQEGKVARGEGYMRGTEGAICGLRSALTNVSIRPLPCFYTRRSPMSRKNHGLG